ncbi:type II toxin-antitoxin system RelE/ParE family toxin [Brevundimonas sp. TSRC1-1]|uniref:type II toxin-antitoxin system RelE/ParE family toxin n=1 Tax=Brevundimonas sp. TSRC1-1 TaxID=2804562 RepID=UPI003CF3E304
MKLRFSEQAVRDRRRLAAFLADRNLRAALRAFQAITQSVSLLLRTPFTGREKEDHRELYIRFGDSGYVVQYRVDADAVVVARIFHAREDR